MTKAKSPLAEDMWILQKWPHFQVDPACHPHSLFFFLRSSTPARGNGVEAALAAGMAHAPLGMARTTVDGSRLRDWTGPRSCLSQKEAQR